MTPAPSCGMPLVRASFWYAGIDAHKASFASFVRWGTSSHVAVTMKRATYEYLRGWRMRTGAPISWSQYMRGW
jgi:hypothetical protein